MPQVYRPPYSPTAPGPLVARKSFILSGTRYEQGDGQFVDVSGIEARRVRQMYDHWMIDYAEHAKELAAASPKPAEAPTPSDPPQKQGVMEWVKPEKGSAYLEAGGFIATHKGFGKYVILNAAGEEVTDILAGKEEAEKAMLRLIDSGGDNGAGGSGGGGRNGEG